ncbi:efflux RND transporter periplasmic adaptor subunit [Emticicia sp. TH156]|uniref:efflux RND transporter periplasmic adaptor subunit n=1 Tax=Emticicia sp. TH156 TaxID=2067454 RepID=UPI000C7853C2|nr:efflux RND transporter periplasmic adaptor subunit [Emticicia sp. TH156]PLK44715.1 efflux RND transporter periplasmic adaptor subunit [Emticicia sp. TH156]
MTSRLNVLAASGLLVLAGCAPHEPAKTVETKKDNQVQVEKPMPYSGVVQARYSGVVEAQKTTALSFATLGTVTDILVAEGQNIKKGQLLARLDASTAQNAYQAALASQKQAEDAYKRMKPMKENGTLPEIKWVDIETGLQQAKSAVAIAQKAISDCNLYAPVSGVIGKKNVQPGMNVAPSMSVLELLGIQTVYVKIPVPEDEISMFKKGETAEITINAIGKTITGTVKEIGVTADILSHSYPVKIEVQNSAAEIKPGMICSVQTTAHDQRTGVLVSNKALQKDVDGQQFIYLEQGGKATRVNVKTLKLIDNQVLVQGDVPPAANIIVAGQQKLSNGSTVQIAR